jgi:hypothetical protein
VNCERLKTVSQQAESDFLATVPYQKAFEDHDTGHGFGMPMAIMVFGYPYSLAEFIQTNVDDNGLVVGLAPKDRDAFKRCLDIVVADLRAKRLASPPGPT